MSRRYLPLLVRHRASTADLAAVGRDRTRLVRRDPVGTAVKAFLQSAIGAAENGLGDNGYIPIPDAFKSRLSAEVVMTRGPRVARQLLLVGVAVAVCNRSSLP